MKSSISSLIFDLDGTLSDPSLGITRCYNYALEKHGHEPRDPQSLLRLIGPSLDEGFLTILPAAEDQEVVQLVTTYRERYLEVGFSENTIYPGIVEALEHFQNNNVRIGVCTSKREDFANSILSLFEISDYFEFVSGGDVGIPKTRQLSSLLENGLIDENSVMIGDRAIDITSARDNNLDGIGVLWGFGEYEELFESNPRRILRSTSELMSIVT